MKKVLRGLLFCLGILLIFTNLTETQADNNSNFSEKKNLAYKHAKEFVDHKMLGSIGIYTNYLNKETLQKNTASGHQYLSESAGLYLLDLATTGNQAQFKKFYNTTKKNFYHDGVFVYRIDTNNRKKYQVNATIDDLRIIKSLLVYDKVHQTDYYQHEAQQLFIKLKKKVKRGSYLTDYYSIRTKKQSKNVTLSYQDLPLLQKFDPALYKKALKLVTAGFISKKVPLYQQVYNLKTRKYHTKQIVTAQSLLTMEHLAAVGKLPAASQNWLLKKVKSKQLYNVYNYQGVAVEKNNSASDYALAAIIGKTVANKELYQEAVKKLLTLQVNDSGSPIFGSFGDAKTKQVYSFNELLSLLALGNIRNRDFSY